MSVRSHVVQIPNADGENGFRWTKLLEPSRFIPVVAILLVLALFVRTFLIVSVIDTPQTL